MNTAGLPERLGPIQTFQLKAAQKQEEQNLAFKERLNVAIDAIERTQSKSLTREDIGTVSIKESQHTLIQLLDEMMQNNAVLDLDGEIKRFSKLEISDAENKTIKEKLFALKQWSDLYKKFSVKSDDLNISVDLLDQEMANPSMDAKKILYLYEQVIAKIKGLVDFTNSAIKDFPKFSHSLLVCLHQELEPVDKILEDFSVRLLPVFQKLDKEARQNYLATKTALLDSRAGLNEKIPLYRQFREAEGRLLSLQTKLQSAVTVVDKSNLLELSNIRLNLKKIREAFLPLAKHIDPPDYGPKYEGIIKLQQIIQKVGFEGIEAPPPFGISSQNIELFLKIVSPEIVQLWKEMGEAFLKEGSTSNFLEKEDRLEKIKHEIRKAFDIAEQRLDLIELFFPGLEGLIKESQGKELTVRSSGDEDGKVYALAGRHRTDAYISPKSDKVLQSLSRCIISYFEPEALKERIDHGTDPFHTRMRLAEILQEIIGESIGGSTNSDEIPISMVVVTDDIGFSGNQAINDKFLVMRISASYGHGEGIVGSKDVACDAFYILRSRSNPEEIFIVPNCQDKPHRLAPVRNAKTGEVTLELVSNPAELVSRPVLDDSMLRKIFDFGLEVEKSRGTPTDMEIVLRNGKIYPVQGRNFNRDFAEASFADPKKVSASQASLSETRGKVIFTNVSSAVTLRSKDEVLMASSLKEADDLYDKKKHKMIFVKHDEPSLLSHAAVNMGEKRAPVIYHSQPAELQKQLDALGGGKALLICMQEGTLNLINEEIAPAESLVSRGFITHPASMSASIYYATPAPLMLSSAMPQAPKDLKELFVDLRRAETTQIALETLEKIGRHHLLTEFQRQAKSLKGHVSVQSQRTSAAADALNAKMSRAFAELTEVLKQPKSERLEVLFHAKYLETLVLQRKGEGVSVLRLQAAIKSTEVAEEYHAKLGVSIPARFEEEAMLSGTAFVPETGESWLKFLIELEQSKYVTVDAISTFKKFIAELKNSQIFPFWLASFFNKMIISGKPVEAIMSSFLEDYNATFVEVMAFNKQLQSMERRMDDFADPKKFEGAFKALQGIVEYTTDKSKALYNASVTGSDFMLFISAQAIQRMAQLYDTAVKTMKAKGKSSSEQKAELFKRMIQDMWRPMDSSIELLVELLKKKQNQSYNYDFLSEFSKRTRNKIDSLEPTVAMLQSSNSQMSVEERYRVFFCSLNIETLEDAFTLIHQNLLMFSGQLLGLAITRNFYLNAMPLPPLLKRSLAAVTKLERRFQFIGVECTPDTLEIAFNVPLRQHSSACKFVYDRSEQTLAQKMTFYGVKESDRWQKIGQYVTSLDETGVLKFDSPVYMSDMGVDFSWRIDSKEAVRYAMLEYDLCCRFTYERNESVFLSSIENRRYIIPIAQKLAAEYLKKGDSECLGIYDRLIKLDQSFPEALEAIKRFKIKDLIVTFEMMYTYIDRGGQTPRSFFLSIAQTLAEKGYEPEQIFNIAVEAFASFLSLEDDYMRKRIITIFNALLQKKRDVLTINADKLINLLEKEESKEIKIQLKNLLKDILSPESYHSLLLSNAKRIYDAPGAKYALREEASEDLKELLLTSSSSKVIELASALVLKDSPDEKLVYLWMRIGINNEATKSIITKLANDPRPAQQELALMIMNQFLWPPEVRAKLVDFIPFLIKQVTNPNEKCSTLALTLLRYLIDSNMGVQESYELANALMKDETTTDIALALYQSLLSKVDVLPRQMLALLKINGVKWAKDNVLVSILVPILNQLLGDKANLMLVADIILALPIMSETVNLIKSLADKDGERVLLPRILSYVEQSIKEKEIYDFSHLYSVWVLQKLDDLKYPSEEIKKVLEPLTNRNRDYDTRTQAKELFDKLSKH